MSKDKLLATAIDHLTRPTPAVEWLERAGPVAKRLNEEAKHDPDGGKEE